MGCFTMPRGTNYQSEIRKVNNVDFLYDLTYEEKGVFKKEQQIFKKIFQEIEKSEKFILIDMFLFNNNGNKNNNYFSISKTLSKKLIEKKLKNPNIDICFITDPINTMYGSYQISNIENMKNSGIKVIETHLNRMRDSNFTYSIFWRIFFNCFGTSGKGWIENPFDKNAPNVTLRSYLKLLNFKANHRKVFLSENVAIVTSANPHDASSNHSNIAFVIHGKIIEDILYAENSIATFSKETSKIQFSKEKKDEGNIEISYLTEKKILKAILKTIKKSQEGDTLNIAMFYISHRRIIKEIIKASNRGVEVKLIFDATKDAFGRKKNGIPNRIVANEIVKKTKGKTKIRWYKTNGEQFHTKLLYLRGRSQSTVIGGSANYTRRNLNNYNLESVIMINSNNNEKIIQNIDNYFNRIYYNKNGNYTLDYDVFSEKGIIKTSIYRFQEFSGLSTF